MTPMGITLQQWSHICEWYANSLDYVIHSPQRPHPANENFPPRKCRWDQSSGPNISFLNKEELKKSIIKWKEKVHALNKLI